jgi:excisionase family DNA binding protein
MSDNDNRWKQLAHMIAAYVLREIQEQTKNGSGHEKPINARLLTVAEAAEYLGRPGASSIYHLVYRKEIPCVTHGRNLRFDVRELDKWIERDKV